MLLISFGFLLALLSDSVLASSELQRSNLGSAVIAGLNARSNSLEQLAKLVKRATTDYKPYQVQCPSDFNWIRNADSLSSGETNYLQQRQSYLSGDRYHARESWSCETAQDARDRG